MTRNDTSNNNKTKKNKIHIIIVLSSIILILFGVFCFSFYVLKPDTELTIIIENTYVSDNLTYWANGKEFYHTPDNESNYSFLIINLTLELNGYFDEVNVGAYEMYLKTDVETLRFDSYQFKVNEADRTELNLIPLGYILKTGESISGSIVFPLPANQTPLELGCSNNKVMIQ